MNLMKKCISLIVLFVSVGLAAQSSGGADPSATKPKKKKAASPAAVTADDIRALREALAAQQQQIEQLRQELQQRDRTMQQQAQQINQLQTTAGDAQSKASQAYSSSTENAQTVTRMRVDVDDMKSNMTNSAVSTQEDQKKVTTLEQALNRFKFYGDMRVRGESFFQNGVDDRNRARVRVRFGFDSSLGEGFTAGIALATGANSGGIANFQVPVSENDTLTQFFEKKAIGLDKAYISYNPPQAKWLTVTGGKFVYDWDHTDLSLDPDLNPEGFTERASWNFNHRIIKNVHVNLMQLLFNEVTGGAIGAISTHGVDSNALGGNIGATFQVMPWWSITPQYANLNFNGADAIAQAVTPVPVCATAASTNCIPQPNTPAVGTPLPTLRATAAVTLNANPMTNATYIKGTGTGQTRAFVSGFDYSDFILDNNFTTPWKRLPIRMRGQYLKNLRAKLNRGFAPSKQDQAYMLDFNIGQVKNRHDFILGYTWWRIEQDAVISQFNQDDQRTPTNGLQNRIIAGWMVTKNVQANFTAWIGRTLNRNLQNAVLAPGLAAGRQDPYLTRFQLDLIYKF